MNKLTKEQLERIYELEREEDEERAALKEQEKKELELIEKFENDYNFKGDASCEDIWREEVRSIIAFEKEDGSIISSLIGSWGDVSRTLNEEFNDEKSALKLSEIG